MKVNFLTSRMTEKLLLLAILAMMPLPAPAESSQSLAEIRQVAEQFALTRIDSSGLSEISASAANMDARLRLKQCDQPLEAFATSNSSNRSRSTVGVRCTGQNPWTLYVPVTISALAEALYTARPLLRGELLDSSAVEVRRMPLDKLPVNSLSDTENLASLEAVRPLRAGVPLTLNAVRARQVVRQGQEVVIEANTAGIQVKMTGTALKSGSYGDLIPVRNRNSGRVIEAAVRNEGLVTVNL
jgi:flagella basal body P-ring formation protein FlgA